MRKEMSGKEIKQRTLDFSSCRYLGEIHEVIREEFELPDWYGANLDALWDSVTGIMHIPAEITVSKKVRSQELVPDIEKIIEVLNEAQEEYNCIIVHVID